MQLGQFLKLINSVTSFLFWNLFIRSKLNCVYKINMDPTLAKLFNRQNNQSTLYFLRVFMRVSYRIGLLLDYSEWNHRSSCMCMHFAITPDYASHRVASPLRAIPLADSTTSRAVHGAFSIRRYSVGDKIFTRHTHRDTHTHTHTHIYIYIYHIRSVSGRMQTVPRCLIASLERLTAVRRRSISPGNSNRRRNRRWRKRPRTLQTTVSARSKWGSCSWCRNTVSVSVSSRRVGSGPPRPVLDGWRSQAWRQNRVYERHVAIPDIHCRIWLRPSVGLPVDGGDIWRETS